MKLLYLLAILGLATSVEAEFSHDCSCASPVIRTRIIRPRPRPMRLPHIRPIVGHLAQEEESESHMRNAH